MFRAIAQSCKTPVNAGLTFESSSSPLKAELYGVSSTSLQGWPEMKKLNQTLSTIALGLAALAAPMGAQAASSLVDGPWTFTMLDQSNSAPFFYQWTSTTTFTQTLASGSIYNVSGVFDWYYGPSGGPANLEGTETFGLGSTFDDSTGVLHIEGLSIVGYPSTIKTLSTRTYDLQLALGQPLDTLTGTWETCGQSCMGSVSAFANAAPVPEPETWAMFSVGLAGLAAVARRRKQHATA